MTFVAREVTGNARCWGEWVVFGTTLDEDNPVLVPVWPLWYPLGTELPVRVPLVPVPSRELPDVPVQPLLPEAPDVPVHPVLSPEAPEVPVQPLLAPDVPTHELLEP